MLPNDNIAILSGQRLRAAVLTFFMRRVRDHAEAEDLTQEVMVRLSRQTTVIDPARSDAYVFTIAANLLRDRARRTAVRASYRSSLADDEMAHIEERDPARILQGKESLAVVFAALTELPERTRNIFILFRLENMTQREIAAALGVSLRTVEQHVVRASVYLRHKLIEAT